MKRSNLTSLLLVLALWGCKEYGTATETVTANCSGQYQNIPYNDGTMEPNVVLYLVQEDAKLSGIGCFNGITFNFSGALIQTHAIISFDLLNTNMGDLRNCLIDGYFGEGNFLAGGYTLSPQMGTCKIRFRMVEKAR